MFIDAQNAFSLADNLAQVTGTYNSSNIIDLHMAGIPVLANLQGARDIGAAQPYLELLVVVTTAFASGGAATLQVNLQGAPDNGSGAPGAYTTWWASPVYALATLAAGARLYDLEMPRPPAGVGIPRFLRMTYVIGGATTTAGNVTAAIIIDREDQVYNSTNNAIRGGYPAGINVNN